MIGNYIRFYCLFFMMHHTFNTINNNLYNPKTTFTHWMKKNIWRLRGIGSWDTHIRVRFLHLVFHLSLSPPNPVFFGGFTPNFKHSNLYSLHIFTPIGLITIVCGYPPSKKKKKRIAHKIVRYPRVLSLPGDVLVNVHCKKG